MGAEPGRRFLKQPAEKLKAVFVALILVISLFGCPPAWDARGCRPVRVSLHATGLMVNRMKTIFAQQTIFATPPANCMK